MPKNNNIPKDKPKTPYTLVYHLQKTNNLRLQAKIRAMVNILPEKYN